MKYIKSTKIYFESDIKDGYLVIDGKKIVGYLNSDANVIEYEDYGDFRIIPGICDTHNHGSYGYGLDEVLENTNLTLGNIRSYLKALTFEGVTSCLPTVTENIHNVVTVSHESYVGAAILGIHSEGPYLNRVGEGGRPEEHPDVNLKYVEKMWVDSCETLKLVAMSPEIEGTDLAREYLISKGVKIAYAHSDCKAEDAKKAIDDGYRVSTHTANVMVGIHHRNIGGLGVMLMDSRVECEIICDGLHVSLDFIEMMLKIKDASRFMMISDSATLAGIKPGRYNVGWVTPLNVTEEGFLRDDDGRLLGSSKSVLFGIENLVEKLKIPLEKVIKMSSLNPCTYYGFGEEKGSIKIGKDADLVVITENYKVVATYVEGKKVFDSTIEKALFNPNPHFED